MRKVEFLPAARRDLREIAAHIAQDNPDRARSFVAELRATADRIASRPHGFRLRRELGDDLRSAVHGNYLLFFRHTGAQVHILRVIHGARDLGAMDY